MFIIYTIRIDTYCYAQSSSIINTYPCSIPNSLSSEILIVTNSNKTKAYRLKYGINMYNHINNHDESWSNSIEYLKQLQRCNRKIQKHYKNLTNTYDYKNDCAIASCHLNDIKLLYKYFLDTILQYFW